MKATITIESNDASELYGVFKALASMTEAPLVKIAAIPALTPKEEYGAAIQKSINEQAPKPTGDEPLSQMEPPAKKGPGRPPKKRGVTPETSPAVADKVTEQVQPDPSFPQPTRDKTPEEIAATAEPEEKPRTRKIVKPVALAAPYGGSGVPAQGSLFDTPTPPPPVKAEVSGFGGIPAGHPSAVPVGEAKVFTDLAGKPPTPAQMTTEVGAYAKKHGLTAVQKVLTEQFGVKQVKDLNAEQSIAFFGVMQNG